MEPQSFGPYLIEQRRLHNMTQTELARALHVSSAAVSKWERGICLPELARMEDIARLFRLKISDMLHCEDDHIQEPKEEERVLCATISGSLEVRGQRSIALELRFDWN